MFKNLAKIDVKRILAKKAALTAVAIPFAMLIAVTVKLDAHFEERIDAYFDSLDEDKN